MFSWNQILAVSGLHMWQTQTYIKIIINIKCMIFNTVIKLYYFALHMEKLMNDILNTYADTANM